MTTTKVTEARPAPEVLAWGRALVDPPLGEAVDTLPESLRQIAGYHFGWWEADGQPTRAGAAVGGKAIRPALALLAAEAVGAEPAAALPGAVAVELVHSFSLIQDDVIDGDLTRRHRPTAWSVFGQGPAIVAGDALLALAMEALASEPDAARILHHAVLQLIAGQHADVVFEDRTDVDLAECLNMVEGKTGALLGGACALGAQLGGASATQITQLRGFGVQLGVAFQLADDVLGIWGDPAVTGKPVHADLQRRKKTLPLVAAMTSGTRAGEELARLYRRDAPLAERESAHAAELVERAGGRAWSRQRADELLAGALRALRPAVASGRAAAELGALARLAAHRNH